MFDIDPKENFLKCKDPRGMAFQVINDFDASTAPKDCPSPLNVKQNQSGMVLTWDTKEGKDWVKLLVTSESDQPTGWVPRECIRAVGKPQGYPCRAIGDIKASPQIKLPKDSPPTIDVSKGTLGTIQKVAELKTGKGVKNLAYLITILNSTVIGWVPANGVEIGPRPVGVKIIEDKVSKPLDRYVYKDATGLLFNTASTMIRKWRYEYKTYGLDHIPPSFESTISSESDIRGLAQMICSGVQQAGLAQLFETTDFTLSDMELHSRIKTREQRTSASGIYCIRYKFDGARGDEFYIGSSVDMSVRDNRHDYKTLPTATHGHYLSAYEATGKQMFAICMVDESSVDDYRGAIEQFFVAALDSYIPRVLDPQTAPPTGPNRQRYMLDRKAAEAFRAIAVATGNETGWVLPSQRLPSASFGAKNGLNFKSPLMEYQMQEKLAWTRVDTVDGVARFQRARRRLHITARGAGSLFGIHYHEKSSGEVGERLINFDFKVTPEDDLQAGDEIFPVVEIYLDGRQHPMPWAHLPTVGHFTDWHLGNSVGIYMDWKGRNGWHRQYFTADRDARFPSDIMGALNQYVKIIALRNFLLQYRQLDKREFQRDCGIARVITPDFDHFTQAIRLSTRAPRADEVYEKPERKSFRAIGEELRQLGAENVGTPVTYANRSSCDGCYLSANLRFGRLDELDRSANISQVFRCERDPEKEHCRHCLYMGRPCTFTRSENLRYNTALWRALVFLQNPPNMLQDIADPGYIRGNVATGEFAVSARAS